MEGKQQRLALQPSEAQVFRAAATIYAAYIGTGQVTQGTEGQWLEKSLAEALWLAQRTDSRIQSDDEVAGGGLGGGLKKF